MEVLSHRLTPFHCEYWGHLTTGGICYRSRANLEGIPFFVARKFRTKELESLESCLWDSVVNGIVKKGGW